jgi:DNA polymerase-3 subunit epsilon
MEILIIDIETTGFLPKGRIAEIGIVSLDLNTGEKEIVFDKIINPELDIEILKKSWIVSNGYMTVEEIQGGVLFEEIKEDLQGLISKYPNGVTAYNQKFDFDFLESYGVFFFKKLPCPMLLSTNICKLQKIGRASRFGGYKWPKVEEAYKYFYPKKEYNEIHRGADDAFHEADIVFALHKLGEFL